MGLVTSISDILPAMADSDALGTLIRGARLDKGLSLGQLASAVGRSSSSVRRWERGEASPAGDVIGDLATALDLDPDELGAMVVSGDADNDGMVQPLTSELDASDSSPAPPVQPSVRTTLEDEEAVVEVAHYFEVDAPVDPPPVERQPSRYGRMSSALWGRRDSWIGWVRGFLTALALLFLFMGLVWAFGELMTALKDVLGSFSTGS